MTEKLLSSGDTAAQGQHILTIRATEQCQVNLKMQPQQAAALKTGQEVIAEAAVLKKLSPVLSQPLITVLSPSCWKTNWKN